MPDDHSSGLPTRTGSFRAVVRVGDTVVEYSRAGSGGPVVLLGLPAQADLRHALSQHFRMVVPESGPTGDFVAWLRCFLDGLGLTRVDLVTQEPMIAGVLEFARIEPERIGRLVLLARSGDVGAIRAEAMVVEDRLLLAPDELAPEELTGEVVRFLLAGRQTPVR